MVVIENVFTWEVDIAERDGATVIKFDYTAVPTVKAFTLSDLFIKAIKGPVGSGKSSGCVADLWRRSCRQQPNAKGQRLTRWAIVRNTYQQLKDTTKKTIEEWLPFASWRESENLFRIRVKNPEDGTVVISDWMLRALDRPDQIANLLSLELTGAWLNESRELPKEVFDAIQGRVARYPRRLNDTDGKEVYGPTWEGVILDTNPPDIDHWFYKFFEEKRPENAVLFSQPGGLSADAENLPNLARNYYSNLAIGKDENYIRVYIHGEYGYLRTGQPVWPNYSDAIHVAKETLVPIAGLPIIIGMDCGLMPSLVVTQTDQWGRVYVLDALTGNRMSARDFAVKHIKPLLRTKYPFFQHIIIGDPAGSQRSQVDNRTVFQELRAQGLHARPARTNSIQARISAVDLFLTRMVDGKPAFIVSPECHILRKALSGDYCYRRMRTSGEKYTDTPDKNDASHIADALQYACLEHEVGFVGYNRPIGLTVQAQPQISVEAWT